MRFVAALASGLRLEISFETDKKKMNFIFNRDKKIFLTKKMKRACATKNKITACFEKIFVRAEPRLIRSRRDKVIWLLQFSAASPS